MKRIALALFVLAAWWRQPAQAFDHFALEMGRSYPFGANLVRVHAVRDWRAWELNERWQVVGYVEVSLGYWHNRSKAPQTPNVWEAAFAPVFQLRRRTSAAIQPYAEFGSGARLISEKHVNERREFGGHLQFGSHISVGARFGAERAYDVSLRLQHISNARLKQPNDGINFASLRFAFDW